jgi:tRNA (guanine-N7-)-methyltransferase
MEAEPQTISPDGVTHGVLSAAKSPSVRKPRLARSATLKHPSEYVHHMNETYGAWAFNEERAVLYKGQWRNEIFKQTGEYPIDLEIGTGNGYHFAHLAERSPTRGLVGIEIKFKPLIQSIKRALRLGATNMRIARYDAGYLKHLFEPGELNNVYIHHPDPWPKERQWKHRLIQESFLVDLHELMRPGSFVDFKTDSADYFEWATLRFHKSPFQVTRETRDLHNSEWKGENFVTHFETIFLNKGQPIFYARLQR